VQVHQGEGLPAGSRLRVMTHDEQGIIYYFGGDGGDSTIRYDLHTQKMTLNTLPKNLKNARISSLYSKVIGFFFISQKKYHFAV
jgi:hypothetical protein